MRLFVTVVIPAIVLLFSMQVVSFLPSKKPSKLKYMDRIHPFKKASVLVICLLGIFGLIPRRGQPLYKGQMARPQSFLCSEVRLANVQYVEHKSRSTAQLSEKGALITLTGTLNLNVALRLTKL